MRELERNMERKKRKKRKRNVIIRDIEVKKEKSNNRFVEGNRSGSRGGSD